MSHIFNTMEMKNHEENLHFSLKSIFNSAIIVLISIIISKILTLAYRIIIARIPTTETISGIEIYGTFTLAVMVVSFLTSFFSLGFHEGMLRYISYYRGKGEISKAQFLFRFVALFTFLTSMVCAILLYIFSGTISIHLFHNPELSIYLKWFSFFIPLVTLSGAFLTVTRAYEKIGWNSFIGNILTQSVKIILLISMLFIGLTNNAIIFSYNLSYIFVLIASFLVCRYVIKEVLIKPEINKETKKLVIMEVFYYSWPLALVNLLSFLFFGMDTLMIGILMDAKSVGLYNAATPLAGLMIISSNLFMQLFSPLISKEFGKNNISLIRDISKQVAKWVYLINLPFLILILFFPGTIINLLFGVNYLPAEFPLRFLAIGIFLYSIFNISQNLVSMAGRSKAVLFNMFISGLVNLILNYFLILKWGILGAAIATMTTYSLWSMISTIQSKYYTSIIPLKMKMIRITLVALVSGIILFYVKRFLPESLFIVVMECTLFLLTYILLILVTKCLDNKDIIVIESIKNKFFKNKGSNTPKTLEFKTGP